MAGTGDLRGAEVLPGTRKSMPENIALDTIEVSLCFLSTACIHFSRIEKFSRILFRESFVLLIQRISFYKCINANKPY